ncbi:hypothetical protein P9386_00270 [Caldifermentibacillus hisashii]|nr:hypothetical protein [Caldifermentibacillus hisashii]
MENNGKKPSAVGEKGTGRKDVINNFVQVDAIFVKKDVLRVSEI